MAMGLLTYVVLGAVLAFIAYGVDFLIDCGFYSHVYTHFPGKCTTYEMNGSEDMVLMPNNHVLISSGLYFHEIQVGMPTVNAGVFLMDLNLDNPSPVNLTFEDNFMEGISQDFSPHGMGNWVTEDGSMVLYVVNHRRDRDTVDSFQYNPATKSLKYRKSFENPELYNLNNLVLVDLDKFYTTRDRYYKSFALKTIENIFRLPFGSVWFVDGSTAETTVKLAADGIKYPNGIAKSNNGRFVYVNHLMQPAIVAYTRNDDNTLKEVQTLPLEIAIDNTMVSPVNGHLWVAIITKPLDVEKNELNPNHDDPVAGRILHVAIDENAMLPFTDYKMEEVFSTDGTDGIGPLTVGLYHENRLLVGTVQKNMMICNVEYLKY